MSEILSQEQINNLLSQKDLATASLSVPESADEASGAPARKDYGALENAFHIFNEQAAGTVSAIFNKKVAFETVSCAKSDLAQAGQTLEAPVLLLTIPFKTGFEGDLYCVVSQKNVAHLSDLMMMGDGNAPYTDDHKDAIVELFGQIFGTYTTALGGKIGEQVSIEHISASAFDLSKPTAQMEQSDMAVVRGTIGEGDSWSMLFLIPDELGKQIMHAMGAQSKSDSAQATKNDETGAEIHDGDNLSSGGDSFVETSLSGDSIRTSASHENIDMLLDVELDVYIELGRTNLSIKRILELAPGSIVELDRMAGEPVDLLVNEKVVAKGEVVVVDENFGVRIVSLVSAEDRIKSLK
jgi:flagellar motor switch protein FliN/FliY